MTPPELQVYLRKLYARLLEHRYRYYVLDHPVISDFEYDWLERYYNGLASVAGAKLMEMVDFDFKDPEAVAAGKRVAAGEDGFSLWEVSMKPVWDRLGRCAKDQKKNKNEKLNEKLNEKFKPTKP